jgi:hypothetical protein
VTEEKRRTWGKRSEEQGDYRGGRRNEEMRKEETGKG